ncbi:MAG: N-acetyltransferase family protein [Alphaproteobacteria bacterium]
MSDVLIRRAVKEDAQALATVRVIGWHQSYAGLMPVELLSKLSIDADRMRIEKAFADPENRALRFVAEQHKNIIGMGVCGRLRMGEIEGRGEVYALYLLAEAKRKGTGRAMMEKMAQALMDEGCTSLQLSVLENNAPARAFYEKLGGVLMRKGFFKYEGFELPDVTYVWDDIQQLARKP